MKQYAVIFSPRTVKSDRVVIHGIFYGGQDYGFLTEVNNSDL